MTIDINKYREQQLKISEKGNFSGTWRPTDGAQNIIRVFLFSHKVTPQDVKDKNFPANQVGKTMDELSWYGERIWGDKLGGDKKPYRATAELKAYCKQREIQVERKYLMNIVDMNDIEKGMQIYCAPRTVYKEILKYLTDPDYGTDNFGAKGADFKIHYSKAAEIADMYSVTKREKSKCDTLPSKLQEQVVDLYDPKIVQSFAKVWKDELPENLNGHNGEDSVPETTDDEFEGLKDEDDERLEPVDKKIKGRR